jgi:hypothetical protein
MADLETPALEIPYANPADALGGAAASMGALANYLEDMLGAIVQFSDASFPVAASGASSETTIDRFTIAAAPFPRRIVCLSQVYTTYTQSAELDHRWYVDASVIGRSRQLHVAAAATERVAFGLGDLAAGGAGYVAELRIGRNTGTGTMSTSISGGLHKAAVLLIPEA